MKNLLLVMSILMALADPTCVFGTDAVFPLEDQNFAATSLLDLRQNMENFRADELPKLQLEGKTAKNAIDLLERLHFQCRLVGEQKNIVYPSKPLQPFIECMQWKYKQNHIYEYLGVGLQIKNWVGDGTPLNMRFDQLIHAEVVGTAVTSYEYRDSRDLSTAKLASKKLDQLEIVYKNGDSLVDLVRKLMTRNAGCKFVNGENRLHKLDCIALNITSYCSLASISFDLSEGDNHSESPSLWSKDIKIIGPQGQWTCIKPTSYR